jgi:hypothetical protein
MLWLRQPLLLLLTLPRQVWISASAARTHQQWTSSILSTARKRFTSSVFWHIWGSIANFFTVVVSWILQKYWNIPSLKGQSLLLHHHLQLVTKTPVKRNLQDMLMVEVKTLLSEADRVCSLSQEKKHLAQIDQANKMICAQGKLIENQGASPGAIVVIRWITTQLVM